MFGRQPGGGGGMIVHSCWAQFANIHAILVHQAYCLVDSTKVPNNHKRAVITWCVHGSIFLVKHPEGTPQIEPVESGRNLRC